MWFALIFRSCKPKIPYKINYNITKLLNITAHSTNGGQCVYVNNVYIFVSQLRAAVDCLWAHCVRCV